MLDLSIDLETLGTKPGSPIVSIGACFFDGETGEVAGPEGRFCAHLKLAGDQGAVAHSSGIDPNTMLWWLGQTHVAQGKLLSGQEDAQRVPEALGAFIAFCRAHAAEDLRPWGNGATFDVSLLEALIARAGMDVPWKFWNVRDMRTLVAEGRAMGWDKSDVTFDGVEHDALDDAVHQARVICYMQRKIRGLD